MKNQKDIFKKSLVSSIGKDTLEDLIKQHTCFRETLEALGLSTDSSSRWAINLWCKANHVSTEHFSRKRIISKESPLPFLSDEDLLRRAQVCASVSDICRTLGKSTTGYYHKKIGIRLRELNFDLSLFKSRTASKLRDMNKSRDKTKVSLSDEKFFSKGFLIQGRTLRRRLLAIGMNYTCSACGNGPSWKGLPLTLQVDHINGDPLDNTKENLRFLCPNCHTQTSTYTGGNKRGRYTILRDHPSLCTSCGNSIKGKGRKGKEGKEGKGLCHSCACALHRKVTRPSKELLKELLTNNSKVKVGRSFGVSDKAVVKWCIQYGLDPKNLGRKAKALV